MSLKRITHYIPIMQHNFPTTPFGQNKHPSITSNI